jgi:carboxylesterase type B
MIRALSFVATAATLVICDPPSSPVVDLGYVKYQGFQNATIGINYFRGLRFAQPPTGDLRWRAPIPIDEGGYYNGETLSATQYGPACYQGVPAWAPGSPDEYAPYGQSEDCLLLDILVPMNPISTMLPVVVQFPGGGYVHGGSTTFPGDAMVNRSSGSLIYVQTQYRLGAFGFLGGKAVAENGVLNAGLLDQRAALEWVQKYIDKVGGDPSKVTIMGTDSKRFWANDQPKAREEAVSRII